MKIMESGNKLDVLIESPGLDSKTVEIAKKVKSTPITAIASPRIRQ